MNTKKIVLLNITVYLIFYILIFFSNFFSVKMDFSIIISSVFDCIIVGIIPFIYYFLEEKNNDYINKIYILALLVKSIEEIVKINFSILSISNAIFYIIFFLIAYGYIFKKKQYEKLNIIKFAMILIIGIFIIKEINYFSNYSQYFLMYIIGYVFYTGYMLSALLFFQKKYEKMAKKTTTK